MPAASNLHDAARIYAGRGWAIFPCNGKQPYTARGFKDASSDLAQIDAWWTQWPDANIGFVPASADLIVLDVDSPAGLEYARNRGWLLDDTTRVTTRPGRCHYYYNAGGAKYPNLTLVKDLRRDLSHDQRVHFDVRCGGGYVLIPPSIHPETGLAYTDECGNATDPYLDLPESLRLALESPPTIIARGKGHAASTTTTSSDNDGEGSGWYAPYKSPYDPEFLVEEGQRDATVHKFASWLRGFTEDDEKVIEETLTWNTTHCDPPLDEDVAQKCAISALKYAPTFEWLDASDYSGEPAEFFGFADEAEEQQGVEVDDAQSPRQKQAQKARVAKQQKKAKAREAGEAFTDLGNARRFALHFHKELRFVYAWNSWVVWDGRRWKREADGGEVRRVGLLVKALRAQAAKLAEAGNHELADAVWRHATVSSSNRAIKDMLELAAAQPELGATPELFDTHPMLFNVANGTIDLTTGKLREHAQEDFLTQISPVEFDAGARAPRWERFISEVLDPKKTDEGKKLVAYMQQVIGYTLTGSTQEQCLFFCNGRGKNGKSTLFETLRALIGADYTKVGNPALILDSKQVRPGGAASPDVVRLRSARFVTIQEPKQEVSLDPSAVKQLTGSDHISGRGLYQNEEEFAPTWKIWIASNPKPEVKEETEGFWRRIRLIPFTNVIAKPDEELPLKLRSELPGILNWALDGAQAWREQHMEPPAIVSEATKDYREEHDSIGEFFRENCVPDPQAWASSTTLYKAFKDWHEDLFPKVHIVGPPRFGRMLSTRADVNPSRRNGRQGWLGMRLKPSGDGFTKPGEHTLIPDDSSNEGF
jgi:putative DNA primase/helicase